MSAWMCRTRRGRSRLSRQTTVPREVLAGVSAPPRPRDAGHKPRPSRAAGPCRTHVRGSPPHGEPQDPPSDLPGSAAADGRPEAMGPCDEDITHGEHPLTSEVIATLGV